MKSEFDLGVPEFTQPLLICGHGGLPVGGVRFSDTGQRHQMLAEQGIQGQNGSLQIGPEEILPADAFQIGLGVDADGPLIFADEAAGIIPVQEAELGPEAHHGDAVNVAQELAVVAVEQIGFCRQVKKAPRPSTDSFSVT